MSPIGNLRLVHVPDLVFPNVDVSILASSLHFHIPHRCMVHPARQPEARKNDPNPGIRPDHHAPINVSDNITAEAQGSGWRSTRRPGAKASPLATSFFFILGVFFLLGFSEYLR